MSNKAIMEFGKMLTKVENISTTCAGGPIFAWAAPGDIVICGEAPEDFDISTYEMFQGMPTRILKGGEVLDLGGRDVQVLHTPGHSPGHLCFWEEARGDLYTGDLVYLDTLFAYYPSTDPEAYLDSLELIAALPARRVLPAHHSLEVSPELPRQMRDALRRLKQEGKLRHGAGTFQYDGWAIWL